MLGEQSRWRMFTFIRHARRPVTRDEAADSIGISRKLAAFHLDKMVDAGLLRASYAAVQGTPKVGRRPKVYEPVGIDVSVSIPVRQYLLLADLLLDAVLNESEDESGRDAAIRTAHQRGAKLGRSRREEVPLPLGGASVLAYCQSVLVEEGYEPTAQGPRELHLHNCPFHPLMAKAPDLVCGINHAFLTGYLAGLNVHGIEAQPAPTPGECCVRIVGALE